MNEAEIAQRLQASIPADNVLSDDVIPEVKISTDEQSMTVSSIPVVLDEVTQYKLHNFLNEEYQPNNPTSINQVQFIFNKVSELVGSQDYSLVVQKISEIKQSMGINNDDRQVFKLYNWLRLYNIQTNIAAEMETYHG